MGEVAAEAGVALREHLRRLKAFRFADDDVTDMRGDGRGRTMAVNVIVTTGLKGFHERALRAVAKSNDQDGGVFRVGMDNFSDFQRAHFTQIGGAKDRGGHVVLEGSKRESTLCAGDYLEAFALESVAEFFSEIDIAVDEQNFGATSGSDHGSASCTSR